MENDRQNGAESGLAGKRRRRLQIAAMIGMLTGAGLLAACRDDDDDDRGGKGARTEPGGWRPPPRPVPPSHR